MSVPARFRDTIALRCANYRQGSIPADDKQLSIVIAKEMNRLKAYDAIGDQELSADLEASLADLPAAERMAALDDLGRDNVGGATEVSFDSAGRLVLPQLIRDLVGIKDVALFWGNIKHFEIWAPDKAAEAFADQPVNLAILNGLLKEKGLSL
ncbi:MraZ protein [Sphingomonas vulcanisoli]|uniref:MraZ protein n=1 Tax=Sphingomonas vulcanisoli TaxID=1658060 RepID=A0ABX0TQT8_9SPHN|nr:MraZ protein [Sphingomonas vulcanisoli]